MKSLIKMTIVTTCVVIQVIFIGLPSGADTLKVQTRTIQGIVSDARSGERLPFVSVMIKETKVGTQTNLEGYFVFTNVPDSAVILQARYVGYAVEEVTMAPGTQAEPLRIKMKAVAIVSKEITVTAEQPAFMKPENEPSLTTFSTRQLISLPNVGQVDIFRSLQLLPGVGGTNDGSSGLYVRGGTPDQNLVLFDGMTVYHVDHLFGFFSAFNPDAVKHVQFYKGGYPAVYGGRLSSVVDMVGKTGTPDHSHFGAGLNLLSGNVIAEIPLLNKGSFLFATRRSYSDIIESGAYTSLYNFLTGTQASDTTPRVLPSPRGGFSGRGPFGVTTDHTDLFRRRRKSQARRNSAQDE